MADRTDASERSIFVNPGPTMGALLMWDEVPRAGEIRIRADGGAGWLGP
jgi:hypothetical protein